MSTRYSILTLLLAAAWAGTRAVASEAPCSIEANPPTYPALNAPPTVQVFEAGTTLTAPTGAACFPDPNHAATWITVTSVVKTSLREGDLIRRFGAISQLRGLPYWSALDKDWRPLICAAFAVASADAVQPQADYSTAQLATGTSVYYRITDTRTDSAINYRMQLRMSSPGNFAIDTSNVDAVRKWGITLYKAGDIQTIYFLSERTPGVWSFYSIARAIPDTFLAKGHEKSYINRAIALFRHYMQLPPTAQPPGAP